MSRADLRVSGRTAVVTVVVLSVVFLGWWWAVSHRGDQNESVRIQGIGARLATPDVVWPNGEPQGGHEASPWAQAVHEWNLAYTVAHNNRDVSDATFAQLYPVDLRQNNAEGLLDEVGAGEFPAEYYPGPRPMMVTDVSVEPSGQRAVVTTCAYDWLWGSYAVEDAAESMEMAASATSGALFHNTVELQSNGTFQVTARERPEHDSCQLEGIKLAYFDPAPPYGTITAPWEVIGADGRPLVEPPTATATPTTVDMTARRDGDDQD